MWWFYMKIYSRIKFRIHPHPHHSLHPHPNLLPLCFHRNYQKYDHLRPFRHYLLMKMLINNSLRNLDLMEKLEYSLF
jgi:hypothetical protein